MKKIVSAILVCVLLVGTLFTLVSCGTMLSGKYEYSLSDENKTTYEFSFNKVTKTTTTGAFGYSKTETIEGTYKISETDDGKFSITFTWDVDGEEDIETIAFAQGEENGAEYIKLGEGFAAVTYTKVD